jgi:hypothetical protein
MTQQYTRQVLTVRDARGIAYKAARAGEITKDDLNGIYNLCANNMQTLWVPARITDSA